MCGGCTAMYKEEKYPAYRRYREYKLLQREREKLDRERVRLLDGEMAGSKLFSPIRERVPDQLEKLLTDTLAGCLTFLMESAHSPLKNPPGSRGARESYQQNLRQLEQELKKGTLRAFDRKAGQRSWLGSGLALAQGAALGALGIGLPDLPVFAGMLLYSVQQTGTEYGFPAESAGEKAFVLLILCCAFSPKGEREDWMDRCARCGERLGRGEQPEQLPQLIEETARLLAKALLVLKFVQGIPLAGVVAGAANGPLLGRCVRMARYHYKSRMLAQLEQRTWPFDPRKK